MSSHSSDGGERAATRDDRAPRLYAELAPWFHLLTHPKEYADEAAMIGDLLRTACTPPPETLLELGSGGGNNASHLKRHFACTLVDLAPAMLAVSRDINPECEHLEGDMRTVRLGRTFDAVLVHDACCYLTREEELAAAAETAFVHLRRGGAAVFCPDHVRETFAPSTSHGGHDGDDGRGLRYVEWSDDPDPTDTTYRVALGYLLRSPDGTYRSAHDVSLFGLFPRGTWLSALEGAGFAVRSVPDDLGRDVFIGIKD